jgi:hypothetical protein
VGNIFWTAFQILAGQLGWVEQVIGGLLMLAVCGTIWAISWHVRQRAAKKLGMASLLFIVPCLLIALIAIVGAAYGVGLRNSGTSDASAEKPEPTSQNDHLIKNPVISIDEHNGIYLIGRYARSGGDLVTYVTYRSIGQFGPGIGDKLVINNQQYGIEPRIKIDAVTRFDRNEQAEISVGRLLPVEGGQHVIQWGAEALNNKKVGVDWVSWSGLIILVTKDGKEDSYPFMIISRSAEGNLRMPSLVGPSVLSSLSELETDAK